MTSSSSSIFQDGKLKQGIYKIQNLGTENYLDIHMHSMELCCRPAKDLESKRGFVRLCLPLGFAHLISGKWKIRRLGGGYEICMVSSSIRLTHRLPSCIEQCWTRLIQEALISSAVRDKDSVTRTRFALQRIL